MVKQIGNYEALAKLAQGGTGTVFKAPPPGQVSMERIVALQVLPPKLAAAARAVDSIQAPAAGQVLNRAGRCPCCDLCDIGGPTACYIHLSTIGIPA